MNINPRKLVVPGVIGVAVVALVGWSATRPVLVDAGPVRRGAVRSFVEEEARTRVTDRFELSSPVGGRLLRLDLEEGDAVKKGQVVAEFDPLALTSRVEEAEARTRALRSRLSGVDRRRPKEAEVLRARKTEDLAKEALAQAKALLAESTLTRVQAGRDAERARRLFSDRTIAAAEKETAELTETRAEEALRAREILVRIRTLEQDTAALSTRILEASARDVDWEEQVYKEQIAELEAGLEVLRDDLQRGKIVSPVDGVVLRRFLESETVVAAGTPVLEVGAIESLDVEADMLSEDAARMHPGMKIEVLGRALGKKVLPGKLRKIFPSAFKKISSLGVEQQRVTVVAEFESAGTGLGDRYRVDLRVIFEERENALLVPESALFREKGQWRAFRIDGGRARLVTVRAGIRDGRVREVLDGLTADDVVILHPASGIEDGTRVAAR